MIGLLVAAGAAVGAPARYAADVLVTRRTGGRFPVGTASVNVLGSLVLGVVVGAGLHHGLPASWRALAGTGFCGAFTTYSTFSQETLQLLRDERPRAALGNLLGSAGLSLLAAAAGLAVVLA